MAQHPYLKAAPYCIDVAAPGSGVVLCEAQTAAPACKTQLNQALSAAFGITAKVVLPAWYQVRNTGSSQAASGLTVRPNVANGQVDNGCILCSSRTVLLVTSSMDNAWQGVSGTKMVCRACQALLGGHEA